MDILLTALNEPRPEESIHFLGRGGVVQEVRDVCYADDLTSYSANLRGLQRKADLVSAFTIIAGLDVALAKFRAFHLVWSANYWNYKEAKIGIHTGKWVRTEIALKNKGTIKMLGILHDHLNNGMEQHKAVLLRIKRAVAALMSKQAPNQGINYVIERVIIPRAEYVGSRAPWSLAVCEELDIPINVLIRYKSKNILGYPTAMLYLSNKDYCGLGMTQLSQSIQEGKNRMLHAASVSPDPYLRAVAEAIVDRAARKAGTMAMRSQDFVIHYNPESVSWLSSTLQMHEQAGCRLYQAGELGSGAFRPPHVAAYPTDIVQQVLPPLYQQRARSQVMTKTNVNNY